MKIISLSLLIFILFSCSNKNADKNDNLEIIAVNNDPQAFSQKNTNKIEMIHSIEYYKNKIIEYQDDYYGFKDVSMEITQLMNITSINKIDNFIPDFLTFLVCWFNPKGNVYYLYTFDDNQNILNHYYCGDFVPFNNYTILMEKLTGKIIENGAIAVGDYNNDGVNEIVLFTFYKNIGNVFCVYGFNIIENKLEELCLVPVFINYDNPFPSVEYTGNIFKVLEVVDDEYMELAWNNYIWNIERRKYIKQ
jgi:hypothetical protein